MKASTPDVFKVCGERATFLNACHGGDGTILLVCVVVASGRVAFRCRSQFLVIRGNPKTVCSGHCGVAVAWRDTHIGGSQFTFAEAGLKKQIVLTTAMGMTFMALVAVAVDRRGTFSIVHNIQGPTGIHKTFRLKLRVFSNVGVDRNPSE